MSSAPRRTSIDRKTRETAIHVALDLDGSGRASAGTGIGFLDHMLQAFALNACFDLELTAEGDLAVDQHHTVEDVGIALGEALAAGLGDRSGIARYGCAYAPMDEALVRCAIDVSGRAFAQVALPWQPQLGPSGLDYALVSELCWGLCRAARLTLHLDGLRGDNNHHLCEAAFKALGLALRQAVALDPRRGGSIPSTKGSL